LPINLFESNFTSYLIVGSTKISMVVGTVAYIDGQCS